MSAPGQGGEAAQQGQNGGEAAENGQQAGPDYAALSGQLEQLVGGQEEMRQFLSSEPWKQPAEPEAQQEQPQTEVDLSFLDPADPAYDPENFGANIAAAMRQEIQRAQQEAIAPVQQQLDEWRQEAEYRDLLDEFPEIGENAAEVVKATNAYVEANGLPPEFAQRASIMRLVFLGTRALHAAQNEGAETPQAAQLEGGGGPGAGSSQADSRVDAILKPGGKRGASVLDGI